MNDSWRHSAQQIDPLGWFSGPNLPLFLGVAAVAQGATSILLLWNQWARPELQLIALPLFMMAGGLTSWATRAHRRQFGPAGALPILGLATLGFLISAAGVSAEPTRVEFWWASIAIAMTLAGFAPFSSARQLIAYAAPVLAVVALVAVTVYLPAAGSGHPLGEIVIVVGPVIAAAGAAVVFSTTLVRRTTDLIQSASADRIARARVDDAVSRRENTTMARMSTRVVPFLRGIASLGHITEADRTLAAQLARVLRADLVNAANRSWLDSVAAESGLVVSDPTHLADRMNEAQRSVLRGLLLAVMDNPVVDRDSLLIELRGQADGSTAVALSLDVDLPEGRRVMMLAPYYLTLKTTVDNLSWADGRSMLFKFQIPAGK